METVLDPSIASSSSLSVRYLSLPIRVLGPRLAAMCERQARGMTHDEGAAGAVDHNMDESRKGASGFGSFLEMFQDASTDKSDIER